jgi:hypothetical protein
MKGLLDRQWQQKRKPVEKGRRQKGDREKDRQKGKTQKSQKGGSQEDRP